MSYKISKITISHMYTRIIIVGLVTSCFLVSVCTVAMLKMASRGESIVPVAVSVPTTLVMMGVIFFVTARKQARRFQDASLALDQRSIRLEDKDGVKTIPFSSITKLTLFENPPSLAIVSDNKKYILYGYEKMEEINLAVAQKVDPAKTKKITRKLNVNNPSVILLLSFGGIALFALISFVTVRLGLGKVADSFWSLGAGTYISFFAPETLPRYVKKLGWVLLACGILQLVLNLLHP